MKQLHLSDIYIFVSVYKYIDSNMYILLSENEALVVDPHVSEKVKTWFLEQQLKKVSIILTHEHCDHISGIWWFLENYSCTLICSEECSKEIANKKTTRPLLLLFILGKKDTKNNTKILEQFKKDYVWTTYKSDITYSDEFTYSWAGHKLYFKAIQGHSIGSSFIVLDDKYVFTGDSLLKDYPVILSFPKGNSQVFLEKTIPLLERRLSSNMIVLPGHGKPFVLSDIMNGGGIHVELR